MVTDTAYTNYLFPEDDASYVAPGTAAMLKSFSAYIRADNYNFCGFYWQWE